MDENFREVVDSLHPKLEAMLAMEPVQASNMPENIPIPMQGVYLFSEHGQHLYVGRSNSMPTRLQNHYNGTHRQAAFAFKLARESTGFTTPTYQRVGSRDDLMTKVEFVNAFREARTRIGNMNLRFVEETVPLRQCLLEVYVSVALGTPYNRWNTT